jgi:Protein of unknown function (DUF3631)
VLGRKAARWASDLKSEVAASDPPIPPELHDRAADAWSPLLSIADLAGSGWPQRSRRAAVYLMANAQDDSETTRTKLLADLRDLFEEKEAEFLPSDEIVDHLAKLEGRPWAEFGRSAKPMTKNNLAFLLKPFNVTSKQTWIGGRNRHCYHSSALADAFARYLSPHPPEQNARTLER